MLNVALNFYCNENHFSNNTWIDLYSNTDNHSFLNLKEDISLLDK